MSDALPMSDELFCNRRLGHVATLSTLERAIAAVPNRAQTSPRRSQRRFR
jgi:hypothetical protein